jgi:thiol-disulfide isomerase/thioredoxin
MDFIELQGLSRRGCAVTLVLICVALLNGCSAKEEKPTPVTLKTNAPKPIASLDEAPVLSDEDSALVQAALPATEADKAWRDLRTMLTPPAYPAEWEQTKPTPEQVAEFEKRTGVAAAAAAEKAREFYTKYPTNANAPEAKKREFDLLKVAMDLGNTNSLARLETLEAQRLKDTSLPEEQRIEIRVQQIQRLMSSATPQGISNSLPTVEKAVRSLQADFPDHNDLASLTMSLAEAWLDIGNLEKSRALAEEVAKSKAPDEIKEGAQALVKKVSRVGKPLEIKYTAVDGREVDLQKLKGKVVLVDFWATWCGPCMRELPHVKETYEKLHDKGFEIVGISYDDKKELLERLLSDEKMTWPQYFDEDGAKKYVEEFGVMSIPTMWLVDKKGVLRDLNGREDLATKVEKLLAEK